MPEIFEVVSPEGDFIKYATRQECHSNPDLLHKTVHILLFNKQKQLWLQKRSVTKDIQPDRWDTSVGGHAVPGETTETAAKRETLEETNVNIDNPTFCYSYLMRNNIESELVNTYCYLLDDNTCIKFDPCEISDGKFFSRNKISDSLGKNIFTPNFEEEWQRFNTWQTQNKIALI